MSNVMIQAFEDDPSVERLQGLVQWIAEVAGDDEAAHALEDDVRAAVLRVIARGTANAQEMAAEVLKTEEIEFQRWCA